MRILTACAVILLPFVLACSASNTDASERPSPTAAPSISAIPQPAPNSPVCYTQAQAQEKALKDGTVFRGGGSCLTIDPAFICAVSTGISTTSPQQNTTVVVAGRVTCNGGSQDAEMT